MQRGSPPFISGSLSVPLVAARGLAVGGGLPISIQHLSILHRKNLLELSLWALPVWRCCRITPKSPGPSWGHRNLHIYRGHGKVSQRPQLGSHVASQSGPGHGREVQLPEDSDGCEQLPPRPGASPPDVPESSRFVGTPVELESHQLPT